MNGKPEIRKTPPISTIGLGIIVLLIAAHFILIAFAHAVPSQRFLFVFYYVTLVLLPGYILSLMIMPAGTLPVRIVASAVFGTALVYLVLTVFALLRLDIFFAGIVMPTVSLALVCLCRFRILRARETDQTKSEAATPLPAAISVTLLIVILFAAILVLSTVDPVYYTSDSPDHIAYIRAVSRSHEVFPADFLYENGGTLTRDIRKGLGDALWGTINVLTGRSDAYDIWPLISLLGSILILLSLFSAGVLLFRKPAIGLLAVILFTVSYHGGLTGRQLITIAYSFPFGKIFLVAFLSATILYFIRPRAEMLLLAAAAAIAATGTHINHFLIIAFLTAVFSVVAFCRSTGGRRTHLCKNVIPIFVVSIVGINLPYLLLRYARDFAPNNEIHTHLQGILWFTDKLYITNPALFFRIAGALSAAAFISVFILWNRSRSEKSLSFLLWGVIAIYGVTFNPLLVPFIIGKISYLLLRLEFAVPSVLVSGYLLHALWNRIRGRESYLSVRSTVIGWTAVLLFIGYPLSKLPSEFAYCGDKPAKLEHLSCLDLRDLFETLNEDVPRGSVIASDPVTSYCIPAFTDQFVVCTFDQHSIPNDSTALDRILDCRDIYLPGSTIGEITGILNKYAAHYLVVNGRIPTAISPMYWRPDRHDAANATGKLLRAPDLFEVVYQKDALTLFKYTNGGSVIMPVEESAADRLLGSEIEAGEALALPEAGERGIRVRGLRVNQTCASRGDTIHIAIEWVAVQDLDPAGYISYLRFDTHFEKGPLYGDWYGKIYRKALERIGGHRFRFTAAHLPLNGTFPPDRWPAMRIVHDTISVRIPDDAATGVYSISVIMLTKTHYPNYTLKDIFTDEDWMSGVAMKRILIE